MVDVIDNDWAIQNQNENYDFGADYLGKSKGALRALQVVQKTLRLGTEIGKNFGVEQSSTLKLLDQNLGVGISALGIPRLRSVTSALMKSLSNLKDNTMNQGVSFQKRAAKAVRDTLDAISAYGYVANFIKFNPTVKTITSTADVAYDLIDLPMTYNDYCQAAELESRAEGDERAALEHSKNYYLLGIAKIVVSLAGFILGLSLVFTGAGALSSLALVIMSLTVTILAIDRDFHESAGPYKLIKFDRAHPAVV